MSVDGVVWNDNSYIWNTIPFTWNEIIVVDTIVEQLQSGKGYIESYDNLSDKDKKTFITVIAKVKGNLEYSEPHTYVQSKVVNKNIIVTADDVKLVIQNIYGGEMKIENISI